MTAHICGLWFQFTSPRTSYIFAVYGHHPRHEAKMFETSSSWQDVLWAAAKCLAFFKAQDSTSTEAMVDSCLSRPNELLEFLLGPHDPTIPRMPRHKRW